MGKGSVFMRGVGQSAPGTRKSARQPPTAIDPRAPDPTREGIFRNHNCAGCNSGFLPCREGNPNNCSWPRARND